MLDGCKEDGKVVEGGDRGGRLKSKKEKEKEKKEREKQRKKEQVWQFSSYANLFHEVFNLFYYSRLGCSRGGFRLDTVCRCLAGPLSTPSVGRWLRV